MSPPSELFLQRIEVKILDIRRHDVKRLKKEFMVGEEILLDITEVGGYELRYRKIADNAYTYVTINDAWTNTYNFPWLEGNYVFQIAAFDKNGLYSNFVDLAPK